MDDAHKDQLEGKAQNAWGDTKEKADDVADEVRDRV